MDAVKNFVANMTSKKPKLSLTTSKLSKAGGEYAPLWKDEEGDSSPGDVQNFVMESKPRRGICMSIARALLVILVAFLALTGTVTLFHQALKYKAAHTNNPCYCGKSAAEGESLGCKFSPWSAAFLPAHCRDDFLDAEFEHVGPNADGSWTYYSDAEQTVVTNLSTIANFAGSQTRYFNDWNWHVMHCIFSWRKLHRMQFSGLTMEPRFNTDGHIRHCASVIMAGSGVTSSGVHMGVDSVSDDKLKAPASDWVDLLKPGGTKHSHGHAGY